jgi:hypothetical protein
MRIPFRDLKLPSDGRRPDKIMPSNLAYLELYMAVHNCKDLMEEQVVELQGLLGEKLKNNGDPHRGRSMAE